MSKETCLNDLSICQNNVNKFIASSGKDSPEAKVAIYDLVCAIGSCHMYGFKTDPVDPYYAIVAGKEAIVCLKIEKSLGLNKKDCSDIKRVTYVMNKLIFLYKRIKSIAIVLFDLKNSLDVNDPFMVELLEVINEFSVNSKKYDDFVKIQIGKFSKIVDVTELTFWYELGNTDT